MAPKRKTAAGSKAGEEPATKEARTEEAKPAATPAAPPAAAEPVTEKEVDAPADKRPAIKEPIVFYGQNTTLNVVPTMGGKVLRTLTEGGMQYLIAGARASAGAKAGRYMFEVKVLEQLQVDDQAWGSRNAPKPKQLVRIGFSTTGSSLLLGDSSDAHVCFDSEGKFFSEGKRLQVAKRFHKDQVVAVLLNLDAKSENANTVSLFVDGQRASAPQALPEALKGKALFPHVAFRNMSVQVNFSPAPLKALPFTCRSFGEAAAVDAEVPASPEPKDGKYEVLFPVGYPDEGTFEWLDGFIKKHPQYVELSDRKILEWAASSGLFKAGKGHGKGSNDRPEFGFGVPGMDDHSIRGVLAAAAPALPRNYIVMEVRNNLLEKERKSVLRHFSAPCYKRTALVVMGEPNEEFKKGQLEKVLKVKQLKAETDWRVKKAEKARKKAAAEAKKRAEEARKKLQEEAKKRKEEAEKKKAEAEKKKKAEAEKKDGDEKKEEEKKEEEKKEEEKKEEEPAKMEVDEEKKEPAEPESEEEAEPPKAELTEEEKKTWFAPKVSKDLKEGTLSYSFADFCLPQKAEGFDEIKFEWQKEAQATEYLREKVLARKKVSKVEGLQVSQWFHDKAAQWKKLLAEWQKKQETSKAAALQKARMKKDAKRDDENEEADIFSVEDITDVAGEPLFKHFELTDWALAQLRYELWMLMTAFKKDVNDADRQYIPLAHFTFYFNKYFKKSLTPKHFGVDNLSELTKMVKDTAMWEDEHLMTPLTIDAEEDLSYFVKLTEEARRERQRRIDAGDETARLKVQPAALSGFTPPKPPASQQQQQPKAPKAPGKPAATKLLGAKLSKLATAKPGVPRPPAAPGKTPPAVTPAGAKPGQAPISVPAPPAPVRAGIQRPGPVGGAAGAPKGAAKGAGKANWSQPGQQQQQQQQKGSWGSGGAWQGGSAGKGANAGGNKGAAGKGGAGKGFNSGAGKGFGKFAGNKGGGKGKW